MTPTPDSGPPSLSDLTHAATSGLIAAEATKQAGMARMMENIAAVRGATAQSIAENLASEFYQRISELIRSFDASLDQAHEVGMRLVSFGATVIFHLESMGYYNPSLITFAGKTEAGEPVELIQHVTQISLLLMKLPRKNPSEPKRPIGFQSESGS